MPELRPGIIRALLGQVSAVAEENTRRALTATALAIERETKLNLGKSSHRRNTPTPAHPGGPPSLISGTLRRSVTHTQVVRTFGGWECKVGLASGVFPPYGKGKRTASSRYGFLLETSGLRNGAGYPFLMPAFKLVAPRVRGISMEFFKGPWPHI